MYINGENVSKLNKRHVRSINKYGLTIMNIYNTNTQTQFVG